MQSNEAENRTEEWSGEVAVRTASTGTSTMTVMGTVGYAPVLVPPL